MKAAALRQSCVLALDARPLSGGQGLNLFHWVQALNGFFDVTLFCRGVMTGVRPALVPPSKLAEMIKKIPMLRRRTDWITLCESNQFDRIVKQGLGSPRYFVGGAGQCPQSLQTAKERGARAILDVINVHVDDLASELQPEFARFGITSFLHPLQQELTRRSYGVADKIRVMSDHAYASFIKRGIPAHKLVTAPPPIEDMAKFTACQFENPKFRISCAGLLHPGKGFSYLIDAYEQLKLKNAELIFWGTAGNRTLNKFFNEVTGRNPSISLNPVEIRASGYDKVYGSSHVLVHPSVSDGFGYVVAEAMASGIPVIVTDQTGAKMMIEDGKSGFIVPSRNPQAIAEKLELLYRNPELVREMGRQARRAAEAFTEGRFQNAVLGLFHEPKEEAATL